MRTWREVIEDSKILRRFLGLRGDRKADKFLSNYIKELISSNIHPELLAVPVTKDRHEYLIQIKKFKKTMRIKQQNLGTITWAVGGPWFGKDDGTYLEIFIQVKNNDPNYVETFRFNIPLINLMMYKKGLLGWRLITTMEALAQQLDEIRPQLIKYIKFITQDNYKTMTGRKE